MMKQLSKVRGRKSINSTLFTVTLDRNCTFSSVLLRTFTFLLALKINILISTVVFFTVIYKLVMCQIPFY